MVDGAEARLLRASYSMRAVPVPEGVHEVQFRYEPRLLYLGAGVSLATTLMIALLLLRGSRAPREPAPPASSEPSKAAGGNP